MELSYVWHAVKRFWWAVVICALLGTVFGLARAKPATFTSRATLKIETPANATESQDRRVATEVGRLSSQAFAQNVAKAVGRGATADSIQRDVIVSNASGSDLIDITVNARSGPLAKLIATKYVATYMKQVGSTPGGQSADVANLNAQLRAAQTELNAINDQIDAAGGRASATLLSRQATLQSTVNTLNAAVASAQPANSGASATVIEPGTNPILSGHGKVRSVAPFALAALLAGVLLAVVLARLSGQVLDAEEVEEILGVPVHGRLPQGLTEGPWWQVPPDSAAFLEELCTRVESCEHRGRGLTVLVAGSESTTNSIPLAALMSSRFGLWGLDVVFGGADGQASDLFNRLGRPRQNLTGVIAEADSETTTRLRQLPRPKAESDDLSPISHQMTFVGMSDDADALALRRYGPESVLAILADAFDVVVLAVGPLLEARAAAQLAQLADVVVLAVPVQNQSRKRLQAVARQLANRRGSLIVVDDRDGKGAPASVADYTQAMKSEPGPAPDAAPFPAKESPIERPGSIGGSA